MFYPELSTIENYEIFSEIINKLDIWFASLPLSEQDRITASKLSIKFNVDYDIAESLLEKCCELKILQKLYAITCPECEHILKISGEEQLYDNLSTINSCYNCDEEDFKVSLEDIYIMYKLIKKPTNSPDNIKKRIAEKLKLNESISSSSTLSSQLEKNLANVNKVFYCPDDQEKQKLKQLLDRIGGHFSNTTEKGAALEDLAIELLGTVKCFFTTKEIKTSTNQIDCTIKNTISISSSVFDEIGSFFIAECKNENDKPGNTYYHKLISILRPMGGKFGILFSIKEITSTCNIIARESYLDSKIVIVNININDLKKVIIEDYNLLDLIHAKILNVKINPIKPIIETRLFGSNS